MMIPRWSMRLTGSPAHTETTPCHALLLVLRIANELVLLRSFVLHVENDELAENEQVEEDCQAGTGEPRGVGQDVVRVGGDDQD